MTETGWWLLLLTIALLLWGASEVRFDVWSTWVHERIEPLLHRIKGH
jgi:hypothetical protein